MKNKNVAFGLSGKKDGNMRLTAIGAGEKNRIKYFKKIRIKIKDVVSAGLSHGNKVKIVTKKNTGKIIKNTDGLITNIPGIVLTVTVADCLPIYLYDENKKIIALLHAGWQGIEKDIVKSCISAMNKNFKCKPENIEVFIGPHIRACHFEIKDDVAKRFKKYSKAIKNTNGKLFIDLSAVAKMQLLDLGICDKNIKISRKCTYCDKKYFSYRRDKPKEVRGMVAYIAYRVS